MPPIGRPYVVAAAAVAGAIIAPIAAPAVLGIVGFGVAGPIAGTIAAAIQGPAVAAGSSFAVAQSVAMGGALPAIGHVIAGSITAFAAWISGKPETGEQEGQEGQE